MKLHVEWLRRASYAEGGCWALVSGSGHLVAEMATKGKSKRSKEIAEQIAKAFSISEEIAALKEAAGAA